MTDIKPLYIDGKRDSRRRYVLPSGEIISRREYIKRTEKITPEEKAYQRVREGKAKPGVTSRKYERSLKKKTLEKAQKGKIDYTFEHEHEIESRQMPTKWSYRVSQLAGSYYCRHEKTGQIAISNGFSTAIDSSKKPPVESRAFLILREQAINHALAKFEGDYNWKVIGVYEEVWVDW